MKMLSKKTIAAVVAGTFILAGAASPFIASAAVADSKRPAIEHRQADPAKVAQRLSEEFGISQDTILKYNANGMSFRDIGKAAMLANISGQSIDTVISKKTDSNTWKDVAAAMNISDEQIKSARQNRMAGHMSEKLGIDKETILNLLQQGYHPRQIGVANILAKESGKSIQDVLALKTNDNTWEDVADKLGVDKDQFKKDMKEAKGTFPHHKFHPMKAKNDQ